jgi:L-threonylcarbamoyladenylate synthase
MNRVAVSPSSPEPDRLQTAVDVLRGGGVVAYPTDTLYGLAADPTNRSAVDAIFRVKGRRTGEALPLVAASLVQVERVAGRLPDATRRLAERFWPGPLTLIVDAWPGLAPAVHGETGTVAIRVPDHAVARALAEACGAPITSTSANRSGEPAVDNADDVVRSIGDRLELVIDGGRTPGGPPSTIVDTRSADVRIIRAGAVASEWIVDALRGIVHTKP